MTDFSKKLLKINVRARSMESAKAIFCDLLGGELVHDRGSDTIGDFNGAMVRVGDVTIDLLVPNDPNGRLAGVIDKHGEGLDSICFGVDSMEETQKALLERGVQVRGYREFHGNKVAFIHPKDACGVQVEFIEGPASTRATDGEPAGGKPRKELS